MSEHRHFEEALAAYVLDSLEGDERAELEAHLETCERCRTDLGWLRPATDDLALSVPPLAPPRALRRRVLSAARADVAADRRRAAGPKWRSLRLAPIAAGLATVAIAVGVAAAFLIGESSPGTQTVPVEVSAASSPAATGTLVVRDGAATLEVSRMPRLAEDEVYETWLERDGQIVPASTFIVDRNGDGAATIAGVEGAQKVMVTREPRGGRDTPSTAPVMVASLQ